MDGGAGPCSLELTVSGADAKPVYNATVKVHITYGFGGFHHLDLQAGTNSDGKVKFTGLPSRVHRPPLEFDAAKDQLEGTVMYDPSAECQAKHDLKLEKPKPPELMMSLPSEKSRICWSRNPSFSNAWRVRPNVELAPAKWLLYNGLS